MSFSFYTEGDQDKFRTMRGAIKRRSGAWASAKQAAFYRGRMANTDFNAEPHVGYLADREFIVTADAMISFTTGSRAQIPTIYVWVCDDRGVRRQYRLKGNGNLRDGWSPDPKKTRLEWERED